jgi:integrase
MNGRRRSKTHDTEAEAWDWLGQEDAKRILGIVSDVEASRDTVSQLIDRWLAGHATLAETTRIDYKVRIDKHIKGHPLGSIRAMDVRGMHVTECLKATPENWTRIHVGKILSTFFTWTDDNHLTWGNPYRQSQGRNMLKAVGRITDPRDGTSNTWTPEQFVTFVAHDGDPVYRDFWVFLAATGARRGEGIGLRWANVNAVEGWCWLADNVTTAGREVIRSVMPKNGTRRKAYFGPVIGKMLLARHDEQSAYLAARGCTPTEWVFDRRRGKGPRFFPGVHLAPMTVTERFNRHTAELGLPSLSGPHGLRRTFATLIEIEGFRPSVVTAAMGHRPDMTGRYTKATDEDMRDVAERLTDLLLPPTTYGAPGTAELI